MKIDILFLYSFFLTIFIGPCFPLPLFSFTPFLVLVFFRRDFYTTLFWAFFCGLILDIFSSKHFGIFSFSYLITSFLIFSKKRFFKETSLNIVILSSITSFFFTLIFLLSSFLFDSKIKISAFWCLSDLIIMPIIDGIFAFIFFVLPLKVFFILKKKDKKA